MIVALILWIGGVEVLPNLHLALHDHIAPHHHVGDATIFDHTHAPTKHRAANGRSIQLAHGADSLAHHAMALHTPPFVHLCPLPIDRRPLLRPTIAIIEPESRFTARANARGPPADLAG
ncbi:MAG: hypothetical protein QM831_03550 [Kofleriaceae bacterium]